MHEAELRSQAQKMGVDSIKQANPNDNNEFKVAKVKSTSLNNLNMYFLDMG